MVRTQTKYLFKNHGNQHIFEVPNDRYSVHYMVDKNNSFRFTEVFPKSNLVSKIENDC